MEINERLRAARRAKHFTQKQLGVELGYKPDQAQIIVARWEAGTRPVPIEKLKTVAQLLDIPIIELLP